MILFLNFVENNASVKRYRKLLGMDLDDVRAHTRFLNYYRIYVEMSGKIKELQKGKRNSTALEKIKINNQVRQLRTKYRSRLLKARGLKDEV